MRAQAIYERTLGTYQRLAKYQKEGAVSQERVEQAEKEMTIAKSDLNIAQSDYDSAIAAAKSATSKQAAQTQATKLQQQLTLKEQAGQLEQLQSQLKTARSDYQQIAARIQQLQQQKSIVATTTPPIAQKPVLEPTRVTIVSPIAGTAIEIPLSPGDRVFTGAKLLGIANTKNLKIGVDVTPQQAMLLKSGQRAVVKIGIESESQESIGAITNIAPPIDRSTQHIEVEFLNPKPVFLIGQVGTVYFPK